MEDLKAMTGPLQLTWACAARPLPGMPRNGDASWVRLTPGRAKVAVMDGLGHGFDAAEASDAARRALDLAADETLETQLQALHGALRRTRGAAMALVDADLERGRLRWCGVGNIQGLVAGMDGAERLVSGNGIVGLSLPLRPRVKELALGPLQLLLLATDGISEDFIRDADTGADPAGLAPELLERHARPTDDALIWVGRLHA